MVTHFKQAQRLNYYKNSNVIYSDLIITVSEEVAYFDVGAMPQYSIL